MTDFDSQNNQDTIGKIGKRICVLRKKKGLSREDLAIKIGISHQQLFKYEIGENRITVDRLLLIAEVLNLKIINFFPVDDVGEKIGLPTLDSNEDYQLLEHIAKLRNLSGEELIVRLMALVLR